MSRVDGMKARVAGLLACLLLVGQASSCGWAAEVRPLEFLRALQARDYNDVAVDYLRMLKEKGEVPEELAPIWDLEMSRSLRAAAVTRAYSQQESDQLMAESQKYLNDFLKRNPDHPEAVSAVVSWGTFTVDRALQHLKAARAYGDKEREQKAKHLTDARALLEEARPRFKQAVTKFQAQLTAMPPMPATRTGRPDKAAQAAIAERDRLLAHWMDARFQAALLDFYMAQTYEDPKSEARKKALQNAAEELDRIYQLTRIDARGGANPIGLYAHMWYGKVLQELGDTETAKQVYEEVLYSAPEPRAKEGDKALEPLFAQVYQFSFAILAQENPDKFLDDAEKWLGDYGPRWRRCEGYQGVALEVAKTKLALAAQAAGAEKSRLTQEAMLLLAEMARIRGPHQQEAITLRQKHSKAGAAGGGAAAKTFDEAKALGDAALGTEQWEEAAAAYGRAVELSSRVRDEARLAQVRDGLASAQFGLAVKLFRANKLEECLAAVKKLVRDGKESPVAPAASALGVAAALNFYVAVPANEAGKKQAALEQLERIAEFTEKSWPGKPEADDARLCRGQALLARGKIDEALAVFENVNPKSARYPRALYLAGSTYWQRYLVQKTGAGPGEGKADKEKLAAERAKAVERATKALDGMRESAEAGRLLSPQHVEAQLLVAQMHLEARQPKEAAALLQPLVDAIKLSKPETLDNTTIRICVFAVQAYLALGETARAGEVGMVLADAGADMGPVNAVLVEFIRTLDLERKKADAALTNAKAAGDAKAVEEATARLASTQGMIGSVLKKLLVRKELSVTGRQILADAAAAVGLSAEAGQQYRQVTENPGAPPEVKTRARAKLVGLLRDSGKYEEAYKQAKQLAADHPRALEPMMELGRILQAWAETDAGKFDEAVGQWTKVRNVLQSERKKRPEYYEVIYNAANCLSIQGRQLGASDPAKAAEKIKQAIQLLQSALVLSPKLSGPDMVARYNALLKQLKDVQAKGGAATVQSAGAAKK